MRFDEFSPRRRAAAVLLAAAPLSILAACGDLAPAPAGPDENLSVRAADRAGARSFGGRATIGVTVLDQQGDPVAGHWVVAPHSSFGPYRPDGTLRVGQTDADGFTAISTDEPGAYCVRSSPVAPTSDLLVPPADPAEPPSLAANPGTVVTGTPANDGNLPLTLANYGMACVGGGSSASIRPGDEVTVTLQPPAGDVTGRFQAFGGTDEEVSGWAVADLGALDLPAAWVAHVPDLGVADLRLGLLVTAAPDEGTGAFVVQTPGGDLRVESDKVPEGGGFASAGVETDGPGDVGAIPLEPLLCVTNTVQEADDDGGDTELFGPYLHGFLADRTLEVVGDGFGVSYSQTAGPALLLFRTGDGAGQLRVDYTCDRQGDCSIGGISGTLADRMDVTLGSGGGHSVRWSLAGLPDGASPVESCVASAGDHVPDIDQNGGCAEASLPSSCSNDQPTFGIGG